MFSAPEGQGGGAPLPNYIPSSTPPPPPVAAPKPPFLPKAPTNPFLSDPGYQQALAEQQQQTASAQQSLQNLISQRLIGYGDASLAGQYGTDAAAIRANTLAGNSETARLSQGHDQARQAIINRLAAHGIIFSGDTGYQTGQEDKNYGNQLYDAQQKLLSDIFGYRQSELGQEQSLRDRTLSALQAAYQNYTSNPGLYGTGQPTSGLVNYAQLGAPSKPAAINFIRSKF